ncbi:1-aminocyclopropane-1-carboxylate deaminase/D-cysteine desulfhydrase [Arsukibacterium sp.]|uniref:1-aminocyclopropane-1-carboxylate deaminase/D-cysteine desulfhydrase n=1 Tax=Arsukibacterium sp. TaxID=1977258 RepID=UPI00299D3A5D|nr:pyridoxal-phosphate dependent enzyme [Arsukibacterium sp.]MDX1539553.1 pyridoxal-phosphate dependent enzyme [Arsukibacterium sp.]
MLLPTRDIAGPAANWYRIAEPLLSDARVELWLYCPTTAEPMISGNKWMKLQYHIKLIQQQQYRGLVTFGGAFSNHLAACAASARLHDINAIAYVRADSIDRQNPTLQYCLAKGMTLIAIDRQSYRQRQQADFLQMLADRHPGYLIIPEGGSSALGARGIAGLNLTDTPAGRADVIVTATASGGTLAGLIASGKQQSAVGSHNLQILGLAVVNDPSLPAKVAALLTEEAEDSVNWRIVATAVDQRYAKCPAEHVEFCCHFALTHDVALEPVYTGRALYKLYQMIAAGEIAPGSRVSFFHTGGLQGLAGLHYRQLISQQQYQILSAAAVG